MNIISEDISVAARFNKLYRLMSQSVDVQPGRWSPVPSCHSDSDYRPEQETTEIAGWNH